jgi:hypothetical protein
LKKQLWPDQATYAKEEKRRFEILISHWNLPIKTVELDGKQDTRRISGARRTTKDLKG